MAEDHVDAKAWVGRTEHRVDQVTPVPLAALSATLDRDDPEPVDGSVIAPLRHWLYFLPLYRRSEVGPDGHAQRGGFLPPVSLPRRMWAGGRLEFRHPVHVGDAIERTSTIAKVDLKQGRTGALVFVRVRHEVRVGAEVAIVEEQDIVYRDPPRAGDPAPALQPAPAGASWRQDVVPDDVLLFRYSALTFNGHRIHYDRRYVTEIEGYPGLIVHGPLIAMLQVDLARDNLGRNEIATFAFRAVKPLFDIAPFAVCGIRDSGSNAVRLWAQDGDGNLAMEATATLR